MKRFVDDLLEQARELAQKDPKRPKQANLRRAISSACYALFLALTQNATELLLGNNRVPEATQQVFLRAYAHETIQTSCKELRNSKTLSLFPNQQIPPDLIRLPDFFNEAIWLRHKADYDLSTHMDRLTVNQFLNNTHRYLLVLQNLKNNHREAMCVFASIMLLKKSSRLLK